MSFSRAKIDRFNSIDAALKESATSTNSKLPTKPKNDKWASSKTIKCTPKLPRPVRQRSLSQPSSTTALNTKSPRPRSVDNHHVVKANSTKGDDDDADFYSTTILHMPEQLSKIDEKCNEDSKNSNALTLETTVSETKSNISGIPLRIKNSQANSFNSPRDNKRLASNSHVSTLSRVTTPNKTSQNSNLKTATSNTLMNQFETKKKHMLVLKEELTAKQQLVSDSYKILVELKKKLDQSGIGQVVLEDLNLKTNTSITDTVLMENIKITLNEIPRPLIDLCKELMLKRKSLVDTLDNFVQNKITTDDVDRCLKAYKDDTNVLEKEMLVSCEGQQSLINGLIEKWSILTNNAGDAPNFVNQIEELQEKLKEQEYKLETVTRSLQRALEQSEAYEKKTHHAEAAVAQLKDKLKNLEHDLVAEKHASQTHKEKFSANDQKFKTMKNRVQELETKCKETENKYNELQKASKNTQEQIKTNEHRWLKEKEELVCKNKHDKQILEKLTKDRSCFETRAKSVEAKLREDLEEAKKLGVEEQVKRETLQQKYEHINNQLVEMEIRNKQAMDVVNTKRTYEPKEAENISTEREVELYTELLATRVGLKAAEEKLQSYRREKMRFLDTIQLLQGEHTESITTLQNMQKLTEIEEAVIEKDEIIYRQKIQISSLNCEIEHLKLEEKSILLNGQINNDEESELKLMLFEGKTKIEQLIKKSLDNEQKSITYKHDLDKQSKQLYEMENLLKARQELVTVMKIKKDELQIENNSLNKYAKEIRELLIQSREEAKNRNELVQELTMNLDTKGRACEELEKMIKELEYSLSIANEKRFKLQEYVGAMEKELQSTKAHIINMTHEGKSNRYGIVNSSRSPHEQKLPRNRHCFTFSQNTASPQTPLTANLKQSPISTYPTHFSKNDLIHKPNNLKPISSNSSCDSQNSKLNSTAVTSWLSSYQNIEDIQKRLKFLKSAFHSLSKKMMVQDLKLKQSPLQSYVDGFPDITNPLEQLPSKSKPVAFNELGHRKHFSPLPKAYNGINKDWNNSANPSHLPNINCCKPPNVHPARLNYKHHANRLNKSAINVSSNRNTSSSLLPTKIPRNCHKYYYTRSSLDALRDKHFKQNMNLLQSSIKHSDATLDNWSSSSLIPELPNTTFKPMRQYVASSIPVPKPRYSPLTLPTRTVPLPSLENLSCDPEHICLSARNSFFNNSNISLNQSNSDKYIEKYSNIEENVPDRSCPSRSYLLYTNSNISTYNNTKKHLDQIKSLTKTTYQEKRTTRPANYNFRSSSQTNTSSKNISLHKRNYELSETSLYPKYSTFESSSDSGRSNVSISTVIKCSHLLNNVSKNYSDLLISKKQYVLKLFTQKNVNFESNILEHRGCAIKGDVLDNVIPPSIKFAQSLLHLSSGPDLNPTHKYIQVETIIKKHKFTNILPQPKELYNFWTYKTN